MLISDHQMNALATNRLEAIERAADTQRSVARVETGPTLADRLGDLLLRWGQSLRERSGAVSVQIELEPNHTHHTHAA